MNPKTVMVAGGLAAVLFFGQMAKTEYARIQSRIEATQTKVDKLADESKAAVEDVRRVIKSITERFSKSLDEKAIELQNTVSTEVFRLKQDLTSKPIQKVEMVEHVANDKSKIETFEPPIKPASNPMIVMHSGYSCGPCNAWLATERSKWEKAGWQVDVLKEFESKRGWPWFEITDRDGLKFQVDGPLTNDNFLSAQRKAK